MTAPTRIVVSASRRTDIPAFYMPWFMERLMAGGWPRINPVSRQAGVVPSSPERVHSIVFWSKNFGPFLAGGYGERLRQLGYGLAFNFTVNSSDRRLEPRVPPLDTRLDQLAALCRRFGGASVTWRFDPICVTRDQRGAPGDNLADFERIARAAAAAGIQCCVTSFVDLYAKVLRRQARSGLVFVDPPLEDKRRRVLEMGRRLNSLGVALALCCEAQLLASLPAEAGITAAACVSGKRLMELHPGRVSLARDAGQRRMQGCGCTRSLDIGDYARHACHHDCLFCYANPVSDTFAAGARRTGGRAMPHSGVACHRR
jgi:hypothetical protein